MGIIFSRFRKKESTKETLEKIHDEITLLQEAKASTERSRRKLGLYIIYAWILFIATSVFLYFYYAPSTLREKLLSAIPPLIFIFMIFCTKYCFNYIYQWKLRKSERKLKVLAERKVKLLEDVMETETYKVAKEILELYSPEILHKNLGLSIAPIRRTQMRQPADSPARPSVDRKELPSQIKTPYVIRDSCSEVGRRLVPTAGNTNAYPTLGPNLNQSLSASHTGYSSQGSPKNAKVGYGMSTPARPKPITQTRLYDSPVPSEASGVPTAPPGPPMPRPVLPRERGVFERFVEVLVGDGPSNRYALVCRQCESHNGMALKQEFEYLSYRCVYCYYWNPAKKQRPTAPKLANVPTLTSQLQQALQKKKPDSEKTSSSEDSEQETPIAATVDDGDKNEPETKIEEEMTENDGELPVEQTIYEERSEHTKSE